MSTTRVSVSAATEYAQPQQQNFVQPPVKKSSYFSKYCCWCCSSSGRVEHAAAQAAARALELEDDAVEKRFEKANELYRELQNLLGDRGKSISKPIQFTFNDFKKSVEQCRKDLKNPKHFTSERLSKLKIFDQKVIFLNTLPKEDIDDEVSLAPPLTKRRYTLVPNLVSDNTTRRFSLSPHAYDNRRFSLSSTCEITSLGKNYKLYS